MTRIFTARFFTLSAYDQAAVVEVAFADIEKNYGRFVRSADGQRARQQARRIRKKAMELGELRG